MVTLITGGGFDVLHDNHKLFLMKAINEVIGCQYYHAEEIGLQLATPGDDLFISYSPCIYCAREIVNKGIRRVVYFNEHSKLEGLQYLINNNIQVRKAGLCQNNNF
jgi:deoxycytidylate deaminase